ncbi:NAD-binding protein, partial [Aeromonas veronii]|nr:NAD-binding protein [Aeromonas veronii]
HTVQDKIDKRHSDSVFDIVELSDYSVDTLKDSDVFDVDILVITSGSDEMNAEIAKFAKENGVDRVIARIESGELGDELKDLNIDVFSLLMSTNTLLRALIEAPSIMTILTNQEQSLYQIEMNNSLYDGTMLRNFPFTGDVIFVRI